MYVGHQIATWEKLEGLLNFKVVMGSEGTTSFYYGTGRDARCQAFP